MKKITALLILSSLAAISFANAASSSSTSTTATRTTLISAKSAKNILGENLLFAADGKQLEDLIKITSDPKLDINYANEHGETALIIAVNRGILEPVKHLLSKKADISKKDLAGNTPLNYAVARENLEMVKVLLSAGANVMDLNGENQETALFEAARVNSPEITELLVKKNKKILFVKNAQGDSILFVVAEFGSDRVASKLVKLGANTKEKNSQGKTAAQVALENDYKDLAKDLK